MAFFTATPARTETFQKFTPQQQQLQNQSIGQLQAMLQQGQGGFENIANRARTQFQTQTIPGLAERFTALGGGQRSSAFQGAIGQAGAGLDEALAALGSQHQLGQQNLLANLSMQPSFEQFYIPRQAGALESSLPGILQALAYILPTLLGGAVGGFPGAAVGGTLGSGLGSLFRG